MKRKHIIWISLIALIIIGVIIMANYQSIFKSIVPPNPTIISSKADGSSSTLFEFSVKVMGQVMNKGGDGSIIVETTLFQGNNSWTKTKELYMNAYETSSFEIVFDEAELLNSDPTYNIKAYALGSISN